MYNKIFPTLIDLQSREIEVLSCSLSMKLFLLFIMVLYNCIFSQQNILFNITSAMQLLLCSICVSTWNLIHLFFVTNFLNNKNCLSVFSFFLLNAKLNLSAHGLILFGAKIILCFCSFPVSSQSSQTNDISGSNEEEGDKTYIFNGGNVENVELYFEDNRPYFDKTMSKNVTAIVGKTTNLNCRVHNLGNKTVSYELK